MGADAPILPNTMKVADPQKERPLNVSTAGFMSAITKKCFARRGPYGAVRRLYRVWDTSETKSDN